MQKVFQVYGLGEFQGEIWGDGITVHHANYVGASDICREEKNSWDTSYTGLMECII